MDSTFIIYIVLIASMACQLGATSETSSASSVAASIREEPRWWEFIVYPANSLQILVKNQLAPAYEAKNANDVANIAEIEGIFESWTSLANAFHDEIAKMDVQVEATFGTDLEKTEFYTCRMYYQLWRDKGDNLVTSYRTCRENNEPEAQQHMENLLKVEEHLFSVLGDYYNSIETYRNMHGFLSGLRSLVYSIWTYFKWLFSESTVHSEMTTYIQNSQSLRNIRKSIGEDDACVPPSEVAEFQSLAETIIQNTGICMDTISKKIASKNARASSKDKGDHTKLDA